MNVPCACEVFTYTAGSESGVLGSDNSCRCSKNVDGLHFRDVVGLRKLVGGLVEGRYR